MTLADIDLLKAAEDLVITQEEVESIVMIAIRAAVAGGVLVYMTMAFGKGLGLGKKEESKYVEMAKEI